MGGLDRVGLRALAWNLWLGFGLSSFGWLAAIFDSFQHSEEDALNCILH